MTDHGQYYSARANGLDPHALQTPRTPAYEDRRPPPPRSWRQKISAAVGRARPRFGRSPTQVGAPVQVTAPSVTVQDTPEPTDDEEEHWSEEEDEGAGTFVGSKTGAALTPHQLGVEQVKATRRVAQLLRYAVFFLAINFLVLLVIAIYLNNDSSDLEKMGTKVLKILVGLEEARTMERLKLVADAVEYQLLPTALNASRTAALVTAKIHTTATQIDPTQLVEEYQRFLVDTQAWMVRMETFANQTSLHLNLQL